MIFALKMNKGFSLEKEISIRYLLFIFFWSLPYLLRTFLN